jgi:hypothetical protein
MPRQAETCGSTASCSGTCADASPDRVFAVRLRTQNRYDAGVAGLPGAEKEADLEPRFIGRPAARIDDPAHVGGHPIQEATVKGESAHHVCEEHFVAELEPQGHLPLIVDDSTPVLPA